ncbi:MAG TPA: prepilin peptidase [Actinomycetota bacterium]|nr:prepilin peptidase [Actinomycetota bacterium]
MAWDAYQVVVAALLGLIFGSFGTVIAHRLPQRRSIASGRSRCPSCDTQIAWFENIPVFSYVALRGRCRHCGASISPRYLWIELMSGLLFVAAWWRFGLSLEAVVFAGFFWGLVVLTAIDLEHHLLPNKIVYPLFVAGWAGLAVAAFVDGDLGRLRGAAFGALIFGGFLFTVAFIAPAGMGGGDVKLGFVLGTFLGYAGGIGFTLVGMFLSFVAGGVIGIALLARGGGRKTQVPFGPFLALGTVAGILFGRVILDWYL